MEISEYCVICQSDSDATSFAVKVNEKIRAGWQPYGFFSVTDNSSIRLYQAMVKYKMGVAGY